MISQQLAEILKREMWLAFEATGKDLVYQIKLTAVNKFMVQNAGKPVSVLSIVTRKHMNAFMNAPIEHTATDDEITVRSVLGGLEGKVLSKNQTGYEFPVKNPKQWKAIFANIKARGYYDNKYQGRKDGKVVIGARPFVAPAIREVLKNTAAIFKFRLAEHFNGRMFEGKTIVVE